MELVQVGVRKLSNLVPRAELNGICLILLVESSVVFISMSSYLPFKSARIVQDISSFYFLHFPAAISSGLSCYQSFSLSQIESLPMVVVFAPLCTFVKRNSLLRSSRQLPWLVAFF